MRPVTDMNTIGSSDLTRLATAWPLMTLPRGIGSEWKRSIAPFVRS